MAKQIAGLFGGPPQLGLDVPTRRPADLADVLAGGQATAPMGQPVPAASAPLPGAMPQVAGLFPSVGRGAAAGLAASGQAAPSYDTRSALVNVGTATATGAAAGAAYAGVPGAVAGGVLGLVTSGLNAWMQVDAENKRKSEMDALIREVEEKKDAKDKRDRLDALSQLKYDRKQAAFQKAWGVAQAQRDAITELINANTTLRQRYIQSGVKNAYA